MRNLQSFLSPLAIAALCATAGRPAAAQRAAAPDYVRPVVQNAAAPTEPAALRTVAIYRFSGARNLDMPTQVTVADSAGELVATFRLSGNRSAGPMVVAMRDTALVLRGETRKGLLTLVLYNPEEAQVAGQIVGRWSLGEYQGELRGSAAR
jgi:hypothetical protein